MNKEQLIKFGKICQDIGFAEQMIKELYNEKDKMLREFSEDVTHTNGKRKAPMREYPVVRNWLPSALQYFHSNTQRNNYTIAELAKQFNCTQQAMRLRCANKLCKQGYGEMHGDIFHPNLTQIKKDVVI